jgi:hypothetical protein
MAASERHRRFKSRFQCSNASYTLPRRKHTKANWSSPARCREEQWPWGWGVSAGSVLHDSQGHWFQWTSTEPRIDCAPTRCSVNIY